MDALEFGLQNEEFWSQPWKNISPIQRAMVGGRKDALLMEAPAQANVGERRDVPVLVFQSGAASDISSPPFENVAVLVASRTSDRATFANTAAAGVPPPTGPQGTSWKGRTFTLNLRDRLDIPWERGTFAVRVLMRERASAVRRVELVESGAYEDPEVTRFLEQYRPAPAPVWPTERPTLPSYAADPSTPALPKGAGEGVALAIERVSVAVRGTPLVLRGRFALRVRRGEIMPPLREDELSRAGEASALSDVAPRPTAIIPLTVVITGSKDHTPATVVLRVPTYDEIERAGDVVTGAFAVDLFELGFPATEQTHFAWAFAGDVASEPAVFALLSPQSVPGLRAR